MDDDNRLLSEPPEFPNHQERTGNMSVGAAPTGDEVSPINGDAGTPATPPPPVQDPNAKIVHDVINSDVSMRQKEYVYEGGLRANQNRRLAFRPYSTV
jgi:hypothetical protein